MNKMRLLAGMIVFGSLWGFSECIIGPALENAGLPGGMIMTGTFTMVFLVMSRMLFQQRGMQLGMGLIAGSLRFFNPFGGCHLCSAIAIMAEGLLFELIWNYATTIDLRNIQSLTSKVSLGIFTGFIVFSGGYIVTQIMTPIVSTGFFEMGNLYSFIPVILSKSLIVALMAGISIPIVLLSDKLHLTIKDPFYYPTTYGISALCWIVILLNWSMYI